MQLMGKLRKCGLEGMGRFLSDLLHEPSPCVLLSVHSPTMITHKDTNFFAYKAQYHPQFWSYLQHVTQGEFFFFFLMWSHFLSLNFRNWVSFFFFYNYFFNIYWKFSFCLGFWWAIFLLWLLVLTVETNNVYYVPAFGCVFNSF